MLVALLWSLQHSEAPGMMLSYIQINIWKSATGMALCMKTKPFLLSVGTLISSLLLPDTALLVWYLPVYHSLPFTSQHSPLYLTLLLSYISIKFFSCVRTTSTGSVVAFLVQWWPCLATNPCFWVRLPARTFIDPPTQLCSAGRAYHLKKCNINKGRRRPRGEANLVAAPLFSFEDDDAEDEEGEEAGAVSFSVLVSCWRPAGFSSVARSGVSVWVRSTAPYRKLCLLAALWSIVSILVQWSPAHRRY